MFCVEDDGSWRDSLQNVYVNVENLKRRLELFEALRSELTGWLGMLTTVFHLPFRPVVVLRAPHPLLCSARRSGWAPVELEPPAPTWEVKPLLSETVVPRNGLEPKPRTASLSFLTAVMQETCKPMPGLPDTRLY